MVYDCWWTRVFELKWLFFLDLSMVDRRSHDDLRKIYLHLKAPRFDLHRPALAWPPASFPSAAESAADGRRGGGGGPEPGCQRRDVGCGAALVLAMLCAEAAAQAAAGGPGPPGTPCGELYAGARHCHGQEPATGTDTGTESR
jgi:hypothetical protein